MPGRGTCRWAKCRRRAQHLSRHYMAAATRCRGGGSPAQASGCITSGGTQVVATPGCMRCGLGQLLSKLPEQSKLLCSSAAARQRLPALAWHGAAAGVGNVGAGTACRCIASSFGAPHGGRRAAGSACCWRRLLHCCTAPAVVCAAAWAAVVSRVTAAAGPRFLAPGAAAAGTAAAAPAPTAAHWGWHWGRRPRQLRPPCSRLLAAACCSARCCAASFHACSCCRPAELLAPAAGKGGTAWSVESASR